MLEAPRSITHLGVLSSTTGPSNATSVGRGGTRERDTLMKFRKPLRPTHCLSDIYGAGHVYTARVSDQMATWVGGRDDFASGHALIVAGSTPTICAASVTTAAGISLLEEAGLPSESPVRVYHDLTGYGERLREAAARSERIVTKHLHSPAEVPESASWISRKLLAWLNNKANLGALVPIEGTPRRQLVAKSELERRAWREVDMPVVLKVPSDLPNGAGKAVALCHTSAELTHAFRRFADAAELVVEEYLDIKNNWCLNYATLGSEVVFLGGSEQIVDAAGAYLGNWLAPNSPPPPNAIALGRAVMDQAVTLGFRGIAGFDMGVLGDGAVKVFDLNFRPNGSTPAILLLPALVDAIGSNWCGRLATWTAANAKTPWVDTARAATRLGWLLPLATQEPADGKTPARLRGVLIGETREQVEARNNWLERQGLHRCDGETAAHLARAAA